MYCLHIKWYQNSSRAAVGAVQNQEFRWRDAASNSCTTAASHYVLQSRRDKSYTEVRPVLPSIEQNGWNLEDGVYTPVMCLNLPAPKCGCRKLGCIGNCGCYKNNIPCTPMCKCSAGRCNNPSSNTYTVGNNSDEEDDSDGEID